MKASGKSVPKWLIVVVAVLLLIFCAPAMCTSKAPSDSRAIQSEQKDKEREEQEAQRESDLEQKRGEREKRDAERESEREASKVLMDSKFAAQDWLAANMFEVPSSVKWSILADTEAYDGINRDMGTVEWETNDGAKLKREYVIMYRDGGEVESFSLGGVMIYPEE